MSFFDPIVEKQEHRDAELDFKQRIIQEQFAAQQAFNKKINNSEKKLQFAKKLVQNLYENSVYREKFEVEEEDKQSYQFANKVVTPKVADTIIANTIKTISPAISEEEINRITDKTADNITELCVHDAKTQIVYINEQVENNSQVKTKNIKEKFSLYKEFDRISNIKKTDDGNVENFLISEMSQEEIMVQAVKANTFKKSLEHIGLDLSNKTLDDLINEEMKKLTLLA